MLVIAIGSGIVGREHRDDIAVAVPHLTQVRRAREDVVTRIVGIAAQTMTDAQTGPGVGHDLHQSDRAGRRNRAHVARALGVQHGANPALGNAEAMRSLGDVRCISWACPVAAWSL